MFPDLTVDSFEACPWHGTHRHGVGKTLGLQIWMVRIDPDVTELVGDNRLQLILIQGFRERLLELYPKRARVAVDWPLCW